MAIQNINDFNRFFSFIYQYGSQYLIKEIRHEDPEQERQFYAMALRDLHYLFTIPADKHINYLIRDIITYLASGAIKEMEQEEFRRALNLLYKWFSPNFQHEYAPEDAQFWSSMVDGVASISKQYRENKVICMIAVFLLGELELLTTH